MKLATLRPNNFAAVLNDPDPRDDKADESAFFFSGVDLSDYTVALLRTAEGRVRRYRDALERMRKALATTQSLLAGVDARLGAVARELAEARQDVATARALLAEEQQRADELNANRDRIIADHVKFLAYARVRVAARSRATPSRELDSALEADAVPACLAEHGPPPDEVAAMLGVLRRAPLDWFPALRAQLRLIDQPVFADRLIASLQPVALAPLAASTLQRTSALLASAHDDSVAQFRQAALPQAQAALQAGTSLRSKVDLIARAASIGDLLREAVGRSELQRRAAQEFERIEAIAGCLHARLSQVRAALRLQWAEQYSQFDAARGQLDLGDLSTLPRFGELPREQREDIRELAGWLRGRADRGNAQAVALLADLVRVCLLAASHSPSGELLTGRLVAPRPLNPGLVLQVRPLLPDRVRIGMAVQFFDAGRNSAHGGGRRPGRRRGVGAHHAHGEPEPGHQRGHRGALRRAMNAEQITVQRMRVNRAVPGLRQRVEDALRVSSKPVLLAQRFVLVRRLRLHTPALASAQSLALQLERHWSQLAGLAVAIDMADDDAPAVWAADEWQARESLLQRWLAGSNTGAWYWQRLLPPEGGDAALPQRLVALLCAPVHDVPAVMARARRHAVWRRAWPAIEAAGHADAVLAWTERRAARRTRVGAGPAGGAAAAPARRQRRASCRRGVGAPCSDAAAAVRGRCRSAVGGPDRTCRNTRTRRPGAAGACHAGPAPPPPAQRHRTGHRAAAFAARRPCATGHGTAFDRAPCHGPRRRRRIHRLGRAVVHAAVVATAAP